MFKNYSYLMALSHMSSDIPQGALGALMPTLIAAYGFDYTTAATLMMIFSLSGSFVQPLFGKLADKWNMPWLIIVAILLAELAMSLLGYLPNFWALAAAVTISGVGVAMFHPQGALMVNKLSTDDNRGKNLSIFSFGGQLGFALGPMLGTAVLYYIGLQGTVFLCLPAIIVSLLLWRSLPDLERIGENAAKKAASKAKAVQNNWKGFACLSCCIFGRSVINSAMSIFIALYWINVLGQTKTTGTTVLSVFFAVTAASTLLGGNLADRYGFRRISHVSFLLLFPALALLSVTRNLYLALLLLLPIAVSLSLSYSPMVVLGQLYLPKSVGMASGVTLGLTVSIGGIFSPVLGHIADSYGLEYTFYTMAAICLIPLVMSFFLPKVEGDEKSDRPVA